MSTELKGKKIAILATNGFEQSELAEPRKNLENAGAKVEILSIQEGKIKGWHKTDWGDSVKVDRLVSDAVPADYDALVLPGGQMNPDSLRISKPAVTSWPSIHTDLINAGAKWVDQEVVTDGNLITSRKPEDIPAFSRAIADALTHSSQHLARAS
jgi:protease I